MRAEKEQLAAAKTKLENDLAEATKKVETVEQELIKEHWIYYIYGQGGGDRKMEYINPISFKHVYFFLNCIWIVECGYSKS